MTQKGQVFHKQMDAFSLSANTWYVVHTVLSTGYAFFINQDIGVRGSLTQDR